MFDPVRPTKLGIMLPLMDKGAGMRSWFELREMAVRAEEIGFDSIWMPTISSTS